ncbi:MAG: dipeptidase [Bacteroidetes bacterium]|jgi:acetylornithine deacetylase/succinyl-diaminopimelate desuccinylase-like protein|nr:dipeptidase [Bacteroidota bacterium]
MHQEVLAYIEKNKDRFLAELFDLLRIPSVGADGKYRNDVLQAADFLLRKFRKMGMDKAQLLNGSGFPVVYAEKIVDPQAPTVMIYGHYDVQPADPLDLWTSDPFQPEIRDGKIYARGACDDKGQMYMHVLAVEGLMQMGKLDCNVKFLIEGEEETGSVSLPEVISKYAELLSCDTVLISDTSMLANDTPSISISLRGLSYVEVEVTGPNRDLHSGVYGGAVDNPVNVLCEMIASLKDENGRITIPGFYSDVLALTPEERNEYRRIPFDQAAYNAHLNIAATRGEQGYSTLEQTSARPTLDVNGIWGGYTGEGSKTVLPAQAHAKISMRLVPHQDSETITRLFTEHFERIAPKSVRVKVTPHHGGNPYLTDVHTPAYQAAVEAMTQSFGKAPIATREGGSIPILAAFDQAIKVPIVLMGFGLNSDAIHSPNEHYGIFNYLKGIETICLYYGKYRALASSSLETQAEHAGA